MADVVAAWARGGWIGVDLFFVLSGFLVAGLIFREEQLHGDVRIGRFLARRGLKIYPAFYAMLAVTVIFDLAPFGWQGFFGELLFLQNVVGALWSHTWTLAVEEHFYLLLSLYAWVSLRRARDDGAEEGAGRASGDAFVGLPKLVLGVSAGCLLLRLVQGVLVEYGHRTHLYPTPLRIDSLLFGVCLAYFFHWDRDRFLQLAGRRRGSLVAGGVLLLSFPFVLDLQESFFVQTWGLSLLYLGSGMVLAGLLAGWRRPGPVAHALAWWGGFSYSVYLWHIPLRTVVERGMRAGGWDVTTRGDALLAIALYMGVAAVLGVSFAKLVEMPVLALRDRYFPSRSGKSVQADSLRSRPRGAPSAAGS